MATWPLLAATWAGVSPRLSGSSGSAPLSNSASTTVSCPNLAAWPHTRVFINSLLLAGGKNGQNYVLLQNVKDLK